MDDKTIKILLIEDSVFATRHTEKMLDEAKSSQFHAELQCADRLSAGLKHISDGGIDIVLLDLTLPDSDELDTLMSVRAQKPKMPIVVMSGIEDETVAIEAVQKGAQDYLVKGQVDSNLLKRSILYAIERKRVEEELRKYREHLEEMVEERTAKLKNINEQLNDEINERKRVEVELEGHREHLEETVYKRTDELQKMVNLMAGREVRMAELKKTIQKLRDQLESAGMMPVADDPLKEV